MFEKIKKFYKLGLYNKEQVAEFVKHTPQIIIPEQYEEIVGEKYPE